LCHTLSSSGLIARLIGWAGRGAWSETISKVDLRFHVVKDEVPLLFAHASGR